MPLRSTRPTFTNVATLVISSAAVSVGDARSCSMSVPATAAESVFVGGPDVTSSNGVTLVPGATFSIDLAPGDDLYAVTASGEIQVELLVNRF